MFWGYVFISLLIAWTWLDYFRLMDFHHPERAWLVFATFIGGGLSTGLVFVAYFVGIGRIWEPGAGIDGLVPTLMHFLWEVALVEELAKFLPFLILYRFFRHDLDEPIDYLLFGAASALGFAALENVLYFQRYGSIIIGWRAILSVLVHLFSTALLVYGLVEADFRPGTHRFQRIALGLAAAVAFHGIFDFVLTWFEGLGMLIAWVMVLTSIERYAHMINNAMNNSPHLRQEHLAPNQRVFFSMTVYYLLIGGLQFGLVSYEQTVGIALKNMVEDLWAAVILVMVAISRLSRMQLSVQVWQPLGWQAPIHFPRNTQGKRSFWPRIRGGESR